MTSTTNPRLAGALSRITAAGLSTRHITIETPDGPPMTLTIIVAGRRRASGRKRAEKCGTEPEHDEQKCR